MSLLTLGLQNNVRPIHIQHYRAILGMYHQDSIVYGALGVRLQHLLLSDMKIFDGDTPITDFGARIVQLFYRPFITEMLLHYSAVGLCPYAFTWREVPVTDEDQVRKSIYGEFYDPKRQVVKVRIPVVPDLSQIRIYRKLENFDQQFFVTDEENRLLNNVWVIHSGLVSKPDWTTGLFRSEGGVLLNEYFRLKRAELLHEQVEFSNALPPILIQRQIRGDMQAYTELQAAQVMHLERVRLSPNGFLEMDSSNKLVSDTSHFNDLATRIYEDRQYVDRSDLTHRIEDGFQVAPHVPEARAVIDIMALRERFDERVALVLKIEPSYLPGPSKNQPRALIDPGNATEDNGRNRLIDTLKTIRDDLAISLREVWIRNHGLMDRNVRFDIPLPTTVDLKSVLELVEYGVLPDEVAVEELLNVIKVDRKRVAKHIKPTDHKLKRFKLSTDDVMKQHQLKADSKKKNKKSK